MGKVKNAIVQHPNNPDLLATVLERFELAPAENEDALFGPGDNMNGTKPVIPAIRINKDGIFMFPGDQPTKEFKAVIMHKHRGRAWWKSAQITGSAPDCFSMDGSFCEPGLANCPIPEAVRKANIEKVGTPWVCESCPMAQWGSGFKADGSPSRAKACKETYRLFVLATDPEFASAVPYKLMVPPTSLGAVDEFFTMLTGKGIGYRTMQVTFSLRKGISSDGFPYAGLMLLPNFDTVLSAKDRELFKALHKQFGGGFEEKTVGDFVEGQQTKQAADLPGNAGKTKTRF